MAGQEIATSNSVPTTAPARSNDLTNNRYEQKDQRVIERAKMLRDQTNALRKFFTEIVSGDAFQDTERSLAAALGITIPADIASSNDQGARQKYVAMQLMRFEPRRIIQAMLMSGMDDIEGRDLVSEYQNLASVTDPSGLNTRMRSGLSISYEASRLQQQKGRIDFAKDISSQPITGGELTRGQLGTTERYLASTILPALDDATMKSILDEVNKGRSTKLTKEDLVNNFFSLDPAKDQNPITMALFKALGESPFRELEADPEKFIRFIDVVTNKVGKMSAPDLSTVDKLGEDLKAEANTAKANGTNPFTQANSKASQLLKDETFLKIVKEEGLDATKLTSDDLLRLVPRYVEESKKEMTAQYAATENQRRNNVRLMYAHIAEISKQVGVDLLLLNIPDEYKPRANEQNVP